MEIEDFYVLHLEFNRPSSIYNPTNTNTNKLEMIKLKKISRPVNINNEYKRYKEITEQENPLKICISNTPLSSSPILSSESWPISPRKHTK
jgi:hypothetical protein